MSESDPDRRMRGILRRVARKLAARKETRPGIYFGLGMFGLIGWAVVIPALLATALGVWIDNRWPGPYSWTLMLLVAGVGLGCWNAWLWLQREGDRHQGRGRGRGRQRGRKSR